MASRPPLAVVLVLFLMVVYATAVPASRSLKDEVKLGNIQHQHQHQHQDIKELRGDGEQSLVERRMNVELTDYPGTGANNNHDPKAPGRF